jgi:hypothetical protein
MGTVNSKYSVSAALAHNVKAYIADTGSDIPNLSIR